MITSASALNNAVRDVEAILKLLREQYDIDEAKIVY